MKTLPVEPDGGTGTTAAPAKVPGAAETIALFKGVPQTLNVVGKTTAPATMIEFADLQCPFCRDYAVNALPALVDKYVRTGKVKFVFSGMHFLGPDSEKALRAVYAAGLQGHLWEALDLLYKSQGGENSGWVTDDLLRSVGASIPGFDTEKMLADMSSPEVDAAIAAADQQAQKASVNSTPTFFAGPDRRHAPAHRRDALTPSVHAADARCRRSRTGDAISLGARRCRDAEGVSRLRAAIAILALAGAAVAAYLVYARYTGTRLACTTGGCETVQHSKYAKAAGVPVAVLGLVAYLAVFATALSSRVEAAAIGAAIVPRRPRLRRLPDRDPGRRDRRDLPVVPRERRDPRSARGRLRGAAPARYAATAAAGLTSASSASTSSSIGSSWMKRPVSARRSCPFGIASS